MSGWSRAQAQPTIVSVSPTNNASGVPTSTAVVFTFSEAMNPDLDYTEATFLDISNPFTPLPVSSTWSAGNTVLTCTPLSPFPANKMIFWSVFGENPAGDFLEGDTFGSFTTSSGTGSGTNAITTFSVGKIHHYNQTSAGLPTLDPTTPYGFSSVTSLASNRTANTITLTVPTAVPYNLTQLPPPQSEIYAYFANYTSLSAYDAAFPAGDYTFQVNGATPQTVVVNLPSATSMPQPGAPHVANYAAAQTVNAAQAFVLSWDAFPGGTAADYVDVDVSPSFGSPNPGTPGALTGTATSFTVPAGTLQPATTYTARIGFFRHLGTTETDYAKDAYRATYTEFSVVTTGGGLLVLTNAVFAAGSFSFDVLCSIGQTVTVEYKTNLSANAWQTLLTTNSPADRFHAVSPQAATNRSLFFRAKSGL